MGCFRVLQGASGCIRVLGASGCIRVLGASGCVRVRTVARAVATAIAVAIGGSTSLLACPVCFGAEETSMIDGTKLGIMVMLGITFAVQGAFLGFFLYLRRRAKRMAEIDLETEWSDLQGASRTS